jgi:hypothetical protein
MQRGAFADCLEQLMRVRDVAPKQLARGLGLSDATLVYRWLRNERVPKLDSGHLEGISAVLKLDTVQCEELRRAQTASLAQHPPRKYTRQKSHDGPVRESISKLLDRSRTVPTLPEHKAAGDVPAVHDGALLNASVIMGRERIIEHLTALIEGAPEVSNSGGDDLFFTTQGRYLRNVEPQIQRRLIQAFYRATERGWTISHLWRLDEHPERTIGLLGMMLDLAGSRRYLPFYFRPYGTLTPPYDLAIVAGVAGMLMFSAGSVDGLDVAFVVTEQAVLDSLHAHFMGLREQAELVFQTYMDGRNEMAVSSVLSESEAQPGGRLLVKEGLSALTTPLPWLEEGSYFGESAVRSGRATPEQVSGFLAFTRSRVREFERNVTTYDYLDIVPKRAIIAMVTTGTYDYDSPLVGASAPIPIRVEHLRRTVDLLRTYPRYRMALLDESEEHEVPPSPQMNITGANKVMLGAWTLTSDGSAGIADLLITEPTLVAAFREHFHALWRKITPRNRDKRHVIQWLERQIAVLERMLAEEG